MGKSFRIQYIHAITGIQTLAADIKPVPVPVLYRSLAADSSAGPRTPPLILVIGS